MIVISDNLNTRNDSYMHAVRNRDREGILGLASGLRDNGADIVALQCSTDGVGDEEALPFVAGIVQSAIECPLCLDTRNVEALHRTVPECRYPPIVNYASADGGQDAFRIMEIVSRHKARLVLRVRRGTIPTSLEAKMQIIYELIASANAADIPNERLFADPSIVHIGGGSGQDHLVNAYNCIVVLKEIVEPPINTIAWISNVSGGVRGSLKSRLDAAFLMYLAGAGLDAAMVDVHDAEMLKAVYLVKSFRKEVIFSPADMA